MDMISNENARRLITQVPGWQHSPITDLRPLEGGKTNQNFAFVVEGDGYVLRISGENTPFLGINRRAEFAACSAAAGLGAAPEIVHFFEPEGHLISRFVEGRPLDYSDFKVAESRDRIARFLRRAHQAGPIDYEFDPLRDIDFRIEKMRELKLELPQDIPDLMHTTRRILQNLWCQPVSDKGLCHSDAYPNNFLELSEQIVLVDWEYSGMGDVFYDLAAVTIALSVEEQQAFLAAYYEDVPHYAMDKIAAMRYVTWAWNWTWAKLQVHLCGNRPEHIREEAALLGALREHQPISALHAKQT